MLFPLLETSSPGSLYSWVLLTIKSQTGPTTLPHLQLMSLIPLYIFLSLSILHGLLRSSFFFNLFFIEG